MDHAAFREQPRRRVGLHARRRFLIANGAGVRRACAPVVSDTFVSPGARPSKLATVSRMNSKKNGKRRAVRWVCKHAVWHWRAKRFIFRKDGQPFRFPVFK